MNLYLLSLGCARNLVDSEIMLGRIKRAGWAVVDEPKEADVIVVNTCSFIEDAADESIEMILELAHYKQEARKEKGSSLLLILIRISGYQ
jgi:ribosomal protein S12 methylthiotransferase